MKKLIKVLPLLLVCVLAFSNVFALTIDDVERPFNSGGDPISEVESAVKDVWSTVRLIVQILAVAATVIAGLRYMIASADVRADIKRSTGILILGAVLVFASTTIISFVVSVANSAVTGQ